MNLDDLQRLIGSMLAPLQRRIRTLSADCTITAVNDGTDLQTVQLTLLSGERLANAIRRQPFGLSANPPAGSVGLAICIGGSRTHTIVLGGEDGSRPKGLADGATQLYDASGNYLLLNNDGTIKIKASSTITLDAPAGEATGNWTFDGAVHIKGAVTGETTAAFVGDVSSATSLTDPRGTMSELRDIYDGHDHDLPGGGTSLTPNQLMP